VNCKPLLFFSPSNVFFVKASSIQGDYKKPEPRAPNKAKIASKTLTESSEEEQEEEEEEEDISLSSEFELPAFGAISPTMLTFSYHNLSFFSLQRQFCFLILSLLRLQHHPLFQPSQPRCLPNLLGRKKII